MTLRVVAIVGQTATGKTRLGIEIAHEMGTEMISADSRQVYTGLDLGTGKDLDEYRSVSPPVVCHLIDICDPQRPYTLFHYQRDCYRVLEEKAGDPRYGSGGVPLVMVGGTGLYVEAVIRRFRIADVPENAGLRNRLRGCEHRELVARLAALDPELHARTDLSSTRRVIRALEVADHATRGRVSHSESPGFDIDYAVFGVRIDRATLRRRIAERVKARFEQGMVDEVRRLLDDGIPHERLHGLGLEYRAISAHLRGETTYREMAEDLTRRIRQFAKRQMTYFRGMERRGIPIRWITPDDVQVILDSV